MLSKPENKRAVLVSPSLGGGGAERQVIRLANALASRGIEVWLVAFKASRGEGTDIYKSEIAKNVFLVMLHSERRNQTRISKLRELIKLVNPDVVYSTLVSSHHSVRLACKKLDQKPKIVVSVQNSWRVFQENKWFAPVGVYDRILSKRTIEACREADLIIVPSKGLKDEVIKFCSSRHLKGGSKKSIDAKTFILPNLGFERQSSRTTFNERDPLIVVCARLVPQKNIELFLQTFRYFLKRSDATALILGDGPERDKLENLSEDLKIDHKVQFMGAVQDPRQWFCKARVLVLTSKFEGFGNVIVEAMACGLPVVALDSPYGPRELLADGLAGVCIPVSKEQKMFQAFSNAYAWYLRSEQGFEKTSQAAFERALDYSPNKMASSYENLMFGDSSQRTVINL